MLHTYRNERNYPFCPGCGHSLILNHLNSAFVKLGLDPHRVALVTDIGCQGLGDQYFVVNAFHGLHGRSLAYATGIKLADPDLKVFVLIGDGGTGIGGAHLLNVARRNIGMTVLVMNNFNFGMTGGEHSVTTPPGGVTVTTRQGNLERPLDICSTVAVNGAGYVWRGTAFDRELPDAHRGGFDQRVLCAAGYLGAVHRVLCAQQRLLAEGSARDAGAAWDAGGPAAPGEAPRVCTSGPRRKRAIARQTDPARQPPAGAVYLAAGPRVPARHRGLGRWQGALDRADVGRGRHPLGPVGRAAGRLPGHRADRPQHQRIDLQPARDPLHRRDPTGCAGVGHGRRPEGIRPLPQSIDRGKLALHHAGVRQPGDARA